MSSRRRQNLALNSGGTANASATKVTITPLFYRINYRLGAHASSRLLEAFAGAVENLTVRSYGFRSQSFQLAKDVTLHRLTVPSGAQFEFVPQIFRNVANCYLDNHACIMPAMHAFC